MSAKDIIHDAVKNALIKDGWTITHDPFTLKYRDAKLFADLAAERVIAAEKASEKILVEIKSFLGPSPLHDLKMALGSHQIYQAFLEETHLDYKLYIAIDDITYTEAFSRESFKLIVERYQLSVIVVNLPTEEIEKWIN